MGGRGSGRRSHFGAGACTDELRQLDIRRWQRERLLAPGQRFTWQWLRNDQEIAAIDVRTEPGRVVLTYRHSRRGSEWVSEAYPVRLDYTRCNYGGDRAWFRCPARGCGRRVAILYGGAIFACRRCHDLSYRSQRESESDRTARRIDRIRAQLGWKAGFLNGNGHKPPKMHWKTYWALEGKHEVLVREALVQIAQDLNLI